MPSFLPFGFFADATGGGGGAAGWASAVVGLGGGFGFAYGDAPDMGSAGEASGRGGMGTAKGEMATDACSEGSGRGPNLVRERDHE